MTDHPCFTCRLSDCDERSNGCALRQALRQYDYHSRHKLPVPEELKSRYRIAWRELYQPVKLERAAEYRAKKRQERDGRHAEAGPVPG